MRHAIYAPDNAARTMIAALAGSSVTLAELDSDLRYTAVYSPGLLLEGCQAIGYTEVEIHGLQGVPLTDLAQRALLIGLQQIGIVSLRQGESLYHLDVRVTPLYDDGSVRLSLLATERPIARSEDLSTHQLDQKCSRDLLRTIFDGLGDGLLLVGYDGLVLAVNRHVATLLALGDTVLVGRVWSDIVAEHVHLSVKCVAASLADGQARHERVTLADHGGKQHTLDLQILPVSDEDSNLDQLLVHISDMTDQIQLDAQMMERERFAATGRLAATVAHEVNTPLQAIESCLHLVGRVDTEAERTRYLRLAREEIKRVGYTLRQLLDLYRPSGVAAPLDTNGLIERVLLLTGNSLSRRSIQIECDLSNDLPIVIGRSDEITQVLINLVFNAMQAMPKGGRLHVESGRAQRASDQVSMVIRICDSGVGIAPELLDQIFEPFFTTRADGTGLGLAICRRIIAGYGGTLRVESAPGSGSCFIIEIPIQSL